MNFEKELKSLIKEKYKTVGAFAKKVGLSYSTVNNIFQRDIMGVSIQVVLKICQELNIDVDEIRNDKLIFKHNIENISEFKLYEQLDDIDKAEIRGEMKQMLKGSKYKKKKSDINAAFHTPDTDDDSAPLALQITTSKN